MSYGHVDHIDVYDGSMDDAAMSNAYASSSSLPHPLPLPLPLPLPHPQQYQLAQSFFPHEGWPCQPIEHEEPVEQPMTSKGPMMVDMNMASEGSIAATAGIHTPLAQYAAQMVVWLWYANPPPKDEPRPSPSPSLSNAFERSPPHTTINQLQLAPTDDFAEFVSTLLRITMVSHSVTILALLYIYRLKNRHPIEAGPGTEKRPFIASLILGNKYLDDNTYTNKTWAELTKVPTSEINKMEHEFLYGLDFQLAVTKHEYDSWRSLLDGYIYSRERWATSTYPSPFNFPAQQSPRNTENQVVPVGGNNVAAWLQSVRSHSESPPTNRMADLSFYRGTQATPGMYEHGRKRSAVDAFAMDTVTPAGVYESLRQPAHRQQLHIGTSAQSHTVPEGPRTAVHTPTVDSGLGRSTSLTRSSRQIARFPGRRGSVSSVQHFVPSQEDLRHTATQHAAINAAQQVYTVDPPLLQSLQPIYGSLVRPYHAQMSAIPPENMEFYTCSARAHPGQDGALRKAILRHQAPAQPYYTPANPYPPPDMTMSGQQTPWYPSPADIDLVTPLGHPATLAGPSAAPHTHVPSVPGNFANAGPAGYLYEPQQPQFQYNGTPARGPHGQHATQRTQLPHNPHSHAQGLGQDGWHTRSEWSSPMPPYRPQ